MAANYLNKTAVTYKFKLQVLNLIERDLTEDETEQLWGIYLKKMFVNRLINEHSLKTWIFPKKELS